MADEPNPQAPREAPSVSKPTLEYEETPIIDTTILSEKNALSPLETRVSAETEHMTPQTPADVTPEASQIFGPPVFQPSPSSDPESSHAPPQEKPKRKNHIGVIIFVVLLFGLGVWLAMQLRSFLGPQVAQNISPTETPFAVETPIATTSAAPSATWTTYQVISGTTKQAIAGVSYKLPQTVAAPVCDGSSCPSQGTNLPGGTRFTVAARGKGQLLPDFRGAILTDTTGKEFTMKQLTVGNVIAYEYTGNFTGQTGGGFTFSQMRGILVPVSDTLAVEFNHFAPAGQTTDFAADDALFDQIVATFTSNTPQPTAPIVFPTVAPSATSSGGS